jgi:hypothetical protein
LSKPADRSPSETPRELASVKLDDLITRAEFAAMLKITPKALSSRLYRGGVPEPVRLGRSTMWIRQVAEEYVAERFGTADEGAEPTKAE